MQVSVTSLNSGSNGNCYYIGNDRDGLFVDAGLSCKETEKRMRFLGLSMNKIRGIFISHEHTDHVNGLAVLASKYQLPVYISEKTKKNLSGRFEEHLYRELLPESPVTLGSLKVTSFSKKHDAADPQSFIVASGKTIIGVFTDIGNPCANVISYFKTCHAAFLESNYDEEMLENGKYPFHLKRRIKSDEGHLSNTQALELFTRHKSPHLSHLFLSHLSKENNDPKLVKALFEQHAEKTEIVVASRYEATEVYKIGKGTPRPVEGSQIKLFE